ncbi:endolytic transglycosylase MltG, partial [Desulfovibrio sp. OttesenSCG-928-A18]|nr:endolytic transglycosylase MltG [Desulfovibrio sp. OttesenSCG-928-A18]
LLWLILVGGGLLAYEAYRFLTSPGSENPQDIVISIAPGATFDRVAWDLKKAGAITDVTRFRLLAHTQDAVGKVRAGEYMINTGWTPEQVLKQITEGRAVLYRLAVREGLTWWETARAVEAQGFASYEDFKAVIHDPAFLRAHNIPFDNAEGFLYPETYLLKKPRSPLDRKQAEEVASAMVRMFWKKTEPLWKQMSLAPEAALQRQNALLQPTPGAQGSPPPVEAVDGGALAGPDAARSAGAGLGAGQGGGAEQAAHAGQGGGAEQAAGAVARSNAEAGAAAAGPRTPAEVAPDAIRHLVILASLVEKETGIPAERGRVAGVYANRLRVGMLLQCDPTIIYGIGESFSGAIRRSQIDDAKNRYNTYQHAGLPPGPIASAGIESLNAAAHPEQHEYFYFVATGLDGGHSFSKNLTEHNKAVQLYRARMRER